MDMRWAASAGAAGFALGKYAARALGQERLRNKRTVIEQMVFAAVPNTDDLDTLFGFIHVAENSRKRRDNILILEFDRAAAKAGCLLARASRESARKLTVSPSERATPEPFTSGRGSTCG